MSKTELRLSEAEHDERRRRDRERLQRAAAGRTSLGSRSTRSKGRSPANDWLDDDVSSPI